MILQPVPLVDYEIFPMDLRIAISNPWNVTITTLFVKAQKKKKETKKKKKPDSPC